MPTFHVVLSKKAGNDLKNLVLKHWGHNFAVSSAMTAIEKALKKKPEKVGWPINTRLKPPLRAVTAHPLHVFYQIDQKNKIVTIGRILDYLPNGTPPKPPSP